MDIEIFGKYIQKSQAENFHGQRKKEYVQELAEELFEIRKGVQIVRTTEREIHIERTKTVPDKTKIRNLQTKAIVESAPAYDAMHEINRKTVEATGMRTFHLSRRYALSGTAGQLPAT